MLQRWTASFCGGLGLAAFAPHNTRRGTVRCEEEPRTLFTDDDDDEVVKHIVERRALEIGHQVRCVTCASQNIEESFTEEASEMRKLIRKRLFEGKTEAEIKAELVAVYGESVLYSPQWNFLNAAAFFVPAAAIGAGLIVYWRARRINVPGVKMSMRHAAADELLPDHVLTHYELGAFRKLLSFPIKK